MKKIMILGASILQLPAIRQAKQMGLQVVAVDMNPNAVGFLEEGIECEIVSTIDIPAVLKAAKKHQIKGIMTLASDMPVRTVAVVAKELGLVGISEDTAIKATNKALMRDALHAYDVPMPKYFKVSSKEEYKSIIQNFSNAYIVKPADNSGSRGIYVVFDHTDKKVAMSAYDYSRKHSRNGEVVVEEYMRGPEVSVETISFNGVCHVIQITDKLTTGAPHFVEMGHSQPSMLEDSTKRIIAEVAIAANHALGIESGPSHTEIIVTKEGPKIVELGARLGGDCITTHLVPLSTGVNMVDACIRIAIGEKPDLEIKYQLSSAIRYFQQKAGRIKRISGIDIAKQIPGVEEICIVHGNGESITNITDSASRMGFVIAKSDMPSSAIQICEKAIDCIKIEMEHKNEA